MDVLDLTEQMASDAIAYDRWRTITEANLIVKRVRRPARRAAALKGLRKQVGA
jgi:hypothetical protein